ncbi:hypothetical protein CDL15_Pgr024889 [Punica granatum]|uniref:Sister chromatid cohesion protein SCC4 n=1 Tax=Punica granatum TaxID=22663 RepID=A0A218W9E4_PUNGR|nr:hypothetical protein CDL15_Pgr024889 [Punica granatum]
MEEVAEGLWSLADHEEKKGEIGRAIKCLEAICQSTVSFLPIIEVKTRLRIATLLLKHTHNVNQAKSHLERSHLLLKSIPSCFDLKCRAFSLLSQCYHLVGAISSQKHILTRALDLIASAAAAAADQLEVKLWACNFYSQLANALIIEGDYQSSISALEHGRLSATELRYPELEMFFVTSTLHVHLMQWEDENVIASAVSKCDEAWASIHPERRPQCLGLFFYNELLHIFYRLRICDYKNAAQHIDRLDASMKNELQQRQELMEELQALNQSLSSSDLSPRDKLALSGKQSQLLEQLRTMAGQDSFAPGNSGTVKQAWGEGLELAPSPINGEWLPRNAVYALVDLMVATLGRPKGLFKECSKRIQSGMLIVQEELMKLGITDNLKEVDLQHSAIWMAGVYLMLLMQFLENKVAVELTRSEFVGAQEVASVPACESIIEMLRGQYAHSVGCYSEAAFHYIEAAKLTESKSTRAISQVYAAISYICIGDADSSSLALDLIGPIYRTIDSFVGVREKTCILFAYGLLLMKQHDLQEARNRLARGLQMTHAHLGNLQLVAQYLTILGSLALALHDTVQAREILRSALTLAKKLYDIPTQIWVLSVLTALYQEVGEKGNEMENAEYHRKKAGDLQKRLADAHSSIHHIELVDKVKVEAMQFQDLDMKRLLGGPSMRANLDIPESVGLSAPAPNTYTSRLVDLDLDTGRRTKRKY